MSLTSFLPDQPQVDRSVGDRVRADYERFAREGLPERIEEYLLQRYDLDVSTHYAGVPIANPWGKASGQLSMTARQVTEDVEAGLGFVVLKTVIAEDAVGGQSMRDWAVKESRMVAERITGRSGKEGWTISWKGRGWWQSFDEYLELVREARRIAAGSGTLIVPSCKFHLPTPAEDSWKTDEYRCTTTRLLEAWHEPVESRGSRVESQNSGLRLSADPQPSTLNPQPGSTLNPQPVMPLEKDFSPTLAGSDRAAQQAKILEWLTVVPRLVRESVPAGSVRVGLKLFNALFDDEFQLQMLRTIHSAAGDSRPDYFVYGNRLFDPDREFDGHRGIAYGGPDLSDRNLRVMAAFQRNDEPRPLEWSATGNITTGRMALEYALRGASSFQLHTFFQLPADQYASVVGSKTAKALCELYFHPQTGLVVWMHHLAERLALDRAPIRLRDVIGRGPVETA